MAAPSAHPPEAIRRQYPYKDNNGVRDCTSTSTLLVVPGTHAIDVEASTPVLLVLNLRVQHLCLPVVSTVVHLFFPYILRVRYYSTSTRVLVHEPYAESLTKKTKNSARASKFYYLLNTPVLAFSQYSSLISHPTQTANTTNNEMIPLSRITSSQSSDTTMRRLTRA
jgi:hypothetical protein